ncbi:class I SAM-dependent methyltransferase [Lentzea tibetensis]|uniref:Class I SAM-dependent methyltransferase n=1 Tax=Lentzea tibetensis TaxID=2591470 RepID=A0A563EKD9_9PSEU|nr:class I SAM-dependent methyltransferase [Lentzea tibetensis]TWP46672.1 class I SAM-dependent methyltransferase [Lentzea tibetensis]
MADTKGMNDFLENLRELNSAGGDAGAPGGRVPKDAISSVYDGATESSVKGELWNWGLHEDDVAAEIEKLIPGFGQFDTDTFSEQMYLLTIRELPIDYAGYRTRRVLEIGSGMGEGLNFLSRIIQPERLIGLDLSKRAVDRANSTLSRSPQLEFVQGDAEDLPFADGEFDVVLNIESSHNYPDLPQFFREVARVLKPGGYFSQTDIFTSQRLAEFDQIKAGNPDLEWVHERDISEGVRAAIRRRMLPGSVARQQYVEKKKHLPIGIRRLGGPGGIRLFGADFAGYRNSAFTNLVNKALLWSAEPQPGLADGSYRHNIARRT